MSSLATLIAHQASSLLETAYSRDGINRALLHIGVPCPSLQMNAYTIFASSSDPSWGGSGLTAAPCIARNDTQSLRPDVRAEG